MALEGVHDLVSKVARVAVLKVAEQETALRTDQEEAVAHLTARKKAGIARAQKEDLKEEKDLKGSKGPKDQKDQREKGAKEELADTAQAQEEEIQDPSDHPDHLVHRATGGQEEARARDFREEDSRKNREHRHEGTLRDTPPETDSLLQRNLERATTDQETTDSQVEAKDLADLLEGPADLEDLADLGGLADLADQNLGLVFHQEDKMHHLAEKETAKDPSVQTQTVSREELARERMRDQKGQKGHIRRSVGTKGKVLQEPQEEKDPKDSKGQTDQREKGAMGKEVMATGAMEKGATGTEEDKVVLETAQKEGPKEEKGLKGSKGPKEEKDQKGQREKGAQEGNLEETGSQEATTQTFVAKETQEEAQEKTATKGEQHGKKAIRSKCAFHENWHN